MHIEEHAPKCVSRYLNTLQFLFFSSFFCVRCVQFRFPATERPNIHYIYDVSFFFCTKLNGNSDYWKRIYVCMTFVDEQTYRHHRTVHSKCLSDLTDLHSAEILMTSNSNNAKKVRLRLAPRGFVTHCKIIPTKANMRVKRSFLFIQPVCRIFHFVKMNSSSW